MTSDLSRINLPLCAVCGRTVEEGACRRFMHKNAFELTVWCHGERETVELTMQEAILYGQTLRPGIAFVTHRLPAAPKELSP